MSFFRFAEGSAMFDSTPIENLFLMEYLSTAPENCLRVYLYARMLAVHPELGGDMAQTARFLHMEEEDVYQAFAYWERQGLVKRLTDHPPTYELLMPLRGEGAGGQGTLDRNYYAYRDFNASLQALFGQKQLIEPHEYRIANDWLDVLGYDQQAALRLVQYGVETSRVRQPGPKGVFKRMNKLAAAWADAGCRTLEDVERAIAEDAGVAQAAAEVLKRFAQSRKVTLDELELVKKWMGQWGFTQDQILEACGETTKAAKPSFAYLDAVLRSRHEGRDGLRQELVEVLRELDGAQTAPTPDQLQRYAALRDAGFEAETVKLAAIQCHRRKKNRFEDVEWMLQRWGTEGIYTRTQAEAYIEDMQRKEGRVRKLLEAAGLERRPSMSDLSLYEAWRGKYDEAVIDYAAQCARGMQVPMKYMDKLLSSWSSEGVTTPEEARARHEAGRPGPASPARGAGNPALDYEQREYRDEDFGEEFFVDLDRYAEGGDEK